MVNGAVMILVNVGGGASARRVCTLSRQTATMLPRRRKSIGLEFMALEFQRIPAGWLDAPLAWKFVTIGYHREGASSTWSSRPLRYLSKNERSNARIVLDASR